jgi:hypothetical protein
MNRPVSRKNLGRVILIASLLIALSLSIFTPPAAIAAQEGTQPVLAANHYYVDSVNGSDSNPGTDPDKPWKTLNKVHAQQFAPGSIIFFKRGSVFNGGLVIDDSGTSSQRIKFTAYGQGPRPVFTNPGSPSNHTSGITIKADWVIVERFAVRNARLAGVLIDSGSDHNIVRLMAITKVGEGVKVNGTFNKVLRNYIHNLTMVTNTPGGNDDYGAVGVWLFASNNEVAYNRIVNCKAQSYDYGTDGGTVEFWASSGASVDNNFIHHNYAQGNDGFSEFGGRGGTIYNTRIAYNVIVDNDRSIGMHLGSSFSTDIKRVKFENNTVVDQRDDNSSQSWISWTELGFYFGSPTPETLIVRNNIFYLADYQRLATASTFTHYNNLYFFKGKNTSLGFTLGSGEKIVNPKFMDVAGADFHLTAGSPAIDAGYSLNYIRDFENKSVPVGPKPDIGAYEYR